MIYYLYFSPWNPSAPLPTELLVVLEAFDEGKMVTVIFGLELKFKDKIEELELKSELPIHWILIDRSKKTQNLDAISGRLERIPSDSKVVCLAWDEKWTGCPRPTLDNRSTSK